MHIDRWYGLVMYHCLRIVAISWALADPADAVLLLLLLLLHDCVTCCALGEQLYDIQVCLPVF